jgi:dGTPase
MPCRGNCLFSVMDWTKLLNNNRLRQSRRTNAADARNDFESDFGRIIFSPAVRRMHDKTQVFPLTTDDNIHSRLTHSLEVMSVGYTLAVRICENEAFQQRIGKDKFELFREIPVILKNLCMVHDIGNPPFGHFGETVIQNFFNDFFKSDLGRNLKLTDEQKNDFVNFDGNAQGLRVLTKLQILNDDTGLNLTYATLGAYIKYPNHGEPNESRLETKKVGVFTSEKPHFERIVAECGLYDGKQVVRHPLCYLMEAADSICYLTMDIEDGYNKKLFDLKYLYDRLSKIPCIKDKIEEIYTDKDNYYKNNVTKVVNFRIAVIQALVLLASKNFEDNIDKIEAGEYNFELIKDDSANNLETELTAICVDKIFSSRDINSLEITGHSVIGGLLKHYINLVFHDEKKFIKRANALISRSIIRAALVENGLDENESIAKLNNYSKLRVIVDFVSGMTDQYALDHYQKLSGQKII